MSFQKNTWVTIIFGALWLAAVGAGMSILFKYETTPGASAKPYNMWPAGSLIERAQSESTLVMFGHPQCPCTRASIGELALLMARCQGRLKAKVLFVKPESFPDKWVKTDLWESAAAIPGVTVMCDNGGVEARRFQAKTSGQTFLYDPQGRLLFSGGITVSRGHSGDNPGRSAIVSLLYGEAVEKTNTLVFGCSLFEAETEQNSNHEEQGGKEK